MPAPSARLRSASLALRASLLLLAPLFLLAGCGESTSSSAAPTATGTAAASASASAEPGPDLSRIVSVGGTVSEILAGLGVQDQIVGVDITSLHPPDVFADKKKVGYFRKLSSEGILSLDPSAVVYTQGSGPPPVLAQLKSTGTEMIEVDGALTLEAARQRITTLGKLFKKPDEAAKLLKKLDEDVAKAREIADTAATKPRVMFIYARGNRVLNVAGKEEGLEAMLELVHAQNAMTQFDGYKPMSSESVAAADPDVILMTTRGAESVGGTDGVLKLPGVALTKAGKAGKIVAIDDLALLGFGPRLGEAMKELATALHKSPAKEAAEDGGGS
ncbi:MAG: ABC transporter substrate-binding protein [Myxococcota bacterium]